MANYTIELYKLLESYGVELFDFAQNRTFSEFQKKNCPLFFSYRGFYCTNCTNHIFL